MASVPEPSGQRVLPDGGQQPYQNIRANPDAFGAPIARGLGAVAQEADQASNVLAQHAEVLAGLDNKAKSDEAAINATQAANEIFTKYTLDERGAKALPAFPSYVEDIKKAREEGRGTLTSPMAKQMYDVQTRQVVANLTGSMSRFAAGEQRKYIEQTSISLEANAADLMTLHPGDAGLEQAYLETSARETKFRALNAGLDTPEDNTNTERMLKDSRGKVYATVAINIAVTDPAGAQDYLEARKDLMDPQAYAAAQMKLKPAVMANDAANDAQAAVGEVLGGGTGGPSGFAKFDTPEAGMKAADTNLQSYGKKGIDSISEVISRWAPPSENNTAAYIATVAKATGIGANDKIDLGNPAVRSKLLAAMAVVEKGKNNNPLNLRPLANGSWEGQSVDSASGGAPTSSQLMANMEGAIAKAGARAEARYPGNAVYRNQVEAQAMSFLNRRITAAKDIEGSAAISLLNVIDAGDIQDMQGLLSTGAETIQQYNALPPTGRAAVDSALRRNANELTLERQQTLTTYNGLWANRNNDPQAYLNADINSMDLRAKDRITALKQQQEFRAKPQAMVDKPFNSIIHSPEFASVLGTLGIKRSEGSLQTADYSHLLGAVAAELDNWRAKNPQAVPDTKAQASIIARATAAQGTYRETFLGIPVSGPKPITEENYTEVQGASRAFDVSEEDRKGAIGYLQSQGLPVDEMSIAKVVHDARGTK
jgi:hypothetical protein